MNERARLRMFVALYPPAAAAADLARAVAALQNLPALRATPTHQVHMTAHFIGDVEQRRVAEIMESVQRSAAGLAAFVLSPRRLITLPPAGARLPPRLIAAETNAPATLLELHRRLVQRLARHARSSRFLPHMTLCRFTGVGEAAVDLPVSAAPFLVDRVRLMRSTLLPTGAEHLEVATFELGK